MRQTMTEIFYSSKCVFASVRCCLGVSYSDRCHWRRLPALLFQFKTANTVSETEFQRSRVCSLEGVSWWKEPGPWLMLLWNLWSGLVEPWWQCVPSAIAAVGSVIANHYEWILGVWVIESSKTDGKGSQQIWVRWWELGCSTVTMAGKVLLNWYKAAPCYSLSTVSQIVQVP